MISAISSIERAMSAIDGLPRDEPVELMAILPRGSAATLRGRHERDLRDLVRRSAPPPARYDERVDSLQPAAQAPDRNLALDLVRVTEAGAMAAGRWVGRGDKNGADG